MKWKRKRLINGIILNRIYMSKCDKYFMIIEILSIIKRIHSLV